MAKPLAKKPLIRRPRTVEEAEMDITPMIDCTFLLLIFFLVSSKMNADVPIELPKARHGTAVVMKESIILTVAGEGSDVKVYKGDGVDEANVIAGGSLVEQEEEIARYVEEQSAMSTPPKTNVLIKAARGVKHREVSRVSKAAGQAAVEQLYVAVLESQ